MTERTNSPTRHSMTEGELPARTVERARQLAREEWHAQAERAIQCRHERARLLHEHGYTSRIRTDESGATLVCYPREWVVDGSVDPDRIEDLDRAIEQSIAGPGDPDEWEDIAVQNRAVANRVHDVHGPVHGSNAEALATYMSNHHAKLIAEATQPELEQFRTEYYPRNVWPTDRERAALEESIDLTRELATPDAPEEESRH